ncbi:enoyl-CoA hydratase-related protein [soil metagenome]
MGATVETSGSAVVFTLRWTDRRNALGPGEARELADAVEEASKDETASALILTGEGALCAGGDLRAFADVSAKNTPAQIRTRVYGDVQRIVRNLRDAPMPTIAAVDGAAVGLGLDLALACDMRFVGEKGWVRQGWGNAGLISATGGTWFLEQARRGLLWSLLADQPKIDAAGAVALGLADAGGPSALDSALERAEKLSALPREVLDAYAKLARPESWPTDDYFETCADYQSEFIGSERFRTLAAKLLGDAEPAQ